MIGVGRIFKRGGVRWITYYPERVAMTQFGLRTRSTFVRYNVVGNTDPARA
jgi:hypothetical protein